MWCKAVARLQATSVKSSFRLATKKGTGYLAAWPSACEISANKMSGPRKGCQMGYTEDVLGLRCQVPPSQKKFKALGGAGTTGETAMRMLMCCC